MKGILSKVITITMSIMLGVLSLGTHTYANEMEEHDYVDFSSDRSTYFFRLDGGDNETVFFDFFSPFDPTAKVKSYDPLVMYKLEDKYYINENNVLMINIEDLKKLYDPYFDYEIENNKLSIKHTVYDKLITDGVGERSTTLQYTKKVWDLQIDLSGENNSVTYDYTEYMPIKGGRNKDTIVENKINKEKSSTNNKITFETSKVEVKDNEYYVPLSEVMDIMGKVSIEEEGYLAIQQENLADVTVSVEREEEVDEVVIPSASNVWNPGSVEEIDPQYTWADYMNDVSDGKRTTGWLWRSFYIPSGTNFKDGNGKEITLEADRIVPFNIYVPTKYSKDETRLTYMLHGGTGNENTPTHRTIDRDINMDEYAEEYNYILISPNGWTQNPIWRENQALYSFEKSYEMIMKEFPVDENKVFISGNSLGGRGTLELAMRFPEKFSAISVSAPKIADRAESGKGTVISIEDTKYDLSFIEDMPALITQGIADTTTSFKTQVGNNEQEGSIVKAIMPKLNDATYIAVEEGNHTYAYATTIRTMFDFFEDAISKGEENTDIKELNLQEKSKTAYLDDEKYRLEKSTKVVNGITMISLKDLQNIYGEDFKVYSLNSYDAYKELAANYYTISYNNQTINLSVDNTIYRKNIERYKEDLGTVKSGSKSDEDLLEKAPQFSVAPYEENGEVYVPAEELLENFDLEINVSEAGINIASILIIGCVTVLVIGFGVWKFKK